MSGSIVRNPKSSIPPEDIRWECLNSPELGSSQYVPPGRCGHCACVVGDKMYVFGGMDEHKTTSFVPPGQVEVLDLNSRTWSVIGTTGMGPAMCSGMAAFALSSDTVTIRRDDPPILWFEP